MSDEPKTLKGFPELKIVEPRCKACSLSRNYAHVLKAMHRFRRDEGLGEEAMFTRMRPVFERHGIEPIGSRAIGRHFALHVDFSRVPTIVDDFDLPDEEHRLAALDADVQSMRDAAGMDLALGTNDSDYHRMADLFRRLMRRIAALDADPTAFQNPDGTHNTPRLKMWSDMIANARGIIEGLNKMRNSDRMTLSILESHTRRYALAVAGPMSHAIRSARDELLQSEDPQVRALAGRLTTLVEHDATTIFTTAAVKTLRESQEQYKLLN